MLRAFKALQTLQHAFQSLISPEPSSPSANAGTVSREGCKRCLLYIFSTEPA